MFKLPYLGALLAAVLMSTTAVSEAAKIADPYGMVAPASSAQRKIRIDAMTKYVNVQRGEVILFLTPQGTFAWSFDTDRSLNQFEFARIAPEAVTSTGIRVFVGDSADDR